MRVQVFEADAGVGGEAPIYAATKARCGTWREWRLPGDRPQPYAIYVDGQDKIWLSDFGANSLVRFDPESAAFQVFPLPTPSVGVRQLLGRPGEVWGAESGADRLVVVRY